MQIIGTGLSGLVGSRITQLLPEFEFEDISRKTGTDITNSSQILQRLQQSSAEYVLHLAAFTNVDGAEAEKDLKEKSTAWQVNVEGTKNVLAACEATGKKIIYFSTDMVFSGEQAIDEKYIEEDVPNPKNWYAMTKYEAEKLVQQARIPWTILRIAYPYRAQFEKKEYVRVFLALLSQQKPFSAIADHFFTPTFIDDIATVLDALMTQHATGIFHVTGSEVVSPYDVAQKIATVFTLDSSLVGKTTRGQYFKEKAVRGFNLSLNNGKIEKLGITMKSFDEGLAELKKQITL